MAIKKSKAKSRRSTETFHFSNALVKNNLPIQVPTKLYHQKAKVEDVQFGFFDSSAPNFNTYFPDATEEDFTPQEADYTFPLVRALSQVIVNKYGPLDFSKGNVLRDSMQLLLRQTVYVNHEVMVGNELGTVFEADWQGPRIQDGKAIPAGINARLKIDAKANPKIARGMNSEPPSVHSFSVGVTFEWEKSHSAMEDDAFWRLLGSFGSDGMLIRRVVTKIIAYSEISAVPHGADPYAQIITEKGINNPVYGQRVEKYPDRKAQKAKKTGSREKYSFNQFAQDDYSKMGHFHDYCSTYTVELSQEEDTTIPNNNKQISNNKTEKMEEEFLNSLSEIEALDLGEQEVEDLTDEVVLAAITKLAKDYTKLKSDASKATKAKQKAETDLADAQTKLDENKSAVKEHGEILTKARNEAIRLYKLSAGEETSEAMLTTLAEANYGALTALTETFSKSVDEKFQAKCAECGSTKLTREKSESAEGIVEPGKNDEGLNEDPPTPPAAGGKGGEGAKAKTSKEAFEMMRQKAESQVTLHGEVTKNTENK